MSEASFDGVVEGTYTYNWLGQPVRRAVSATGQVLHILHDPDGNRIAGYVYDPVAGSSSLLREYVWLNGAPLAVIEQDGTPGGTVYFVRTDWIGRPVFATNAAGAKVWELRYPPFGGVHTVTGALIDLRAPPVRR